jgi:predicted transcriptional regulator
VLVTDESEITQALLENVEAALNQREVAALVVPRAVFEKNDRNVTNEWRIIGSLPEHLVETLSAVIERDEVTVRDLVEALGLDSVTACNNRVARLHQLRLVRRKAAIVPEGGRQYCYSSVLPQQK